MRTLIFTSLLLLGCLQAAVAAAGTENETARELEPMVVKARADNEAPDSPFHLPESSLAATWSIDHEGIQALEPRDLFDVLSYAPGVQTCFQGRKGMNFLASRGGGNFIGGSDYAILIDGVYVPWTQSSRVLASFPVDTIETIRVVRDATTLTLAPLTGLGSMGTAVQGVILIKTRTPQKRESQITASYGNLNRSKVFLSHADRLDSTYYSLNYNRLQDDGRDGWNGASDSNAVLFKGGYADDGLSADASFYYNQASRQLWSSLPISKTSDSKWEYDPLDTLMATANVSKRWSANQTTALGLYTGQVSTTIEYRSFSKPASYSEDDQQDNVFQADLHHIVTAGGHNLRVGGQAIFWDCPEGQFYYEGIEREEGLYSAYLHDEYQLNRNWRIDAGARVDYRHIDKGINKYGPTDKTPTVLIEDQWAEPYYAMAAGTAYRFSEVWEASFRVSRTEQGADDFLVSADGQALDPDQQWRYEAGLIAAFHPAVQATLTAFYYDIDNIKQNAGSTKVGKDIVNVYRNADTIRKGVELEIGGSIPLLGLNYALAHSYQRSDNDIDDEGIPHHISSVRLGYRRAPFQCNLMLRHVSPYDSNEFSADNGYHEIGDFSRLDANASYDFTVGRTGVRATLFGQNLTDEEYQTRLGWKDVGMTYGLELSVAI